MDPKELTKALTETLEKTLPEAVEAVVDEKTKSLKDEMDKNHSEVQKQLSEIATAQKFAGGEDQKEIHATTAKFFKTLIRRDEKGFAEAKAAFLNSGADSEGGYLVPTEFAKEVIRVAKEVGFLRRYARIVPMATDTKDISKLINGVSVYWTSQGAAYTGSKPEFGQVKLIANKLTALVSGTNELIEDNMSDTEVFDLVRDLIGEAMAEFEDNQGDNGDGTQPNLPGIFHANTAIQAVTFAVAGKPTFAELVKVKNTVKKKYRKGTKVVWRVGEDMYTHIESLSDENGRPLLKESIKNGSDETMLLGYPIEVGEGTPDAKLAFGNYNFYLLGDRKALTFESGYATGGFEADVQSLKANERIGGVVAIKEAFAIGA